VRGQTKETEPGSYLYRGITARAFEREFDLAEYVDVTGASLQNGLLEISLKRELPEALKPRSIPIGNTRGGDSAKASALKAAS
jgi:molecular chaperone IbpA